MEASTDMNSKIPPAAFNVNSEAPPSAAASSGSDDPNEEDGHHSDASTHEDDEDVMDPQHNGMSFDLSQGIKEPNESDILCGRGRSTSEHPANVQFRALVSQNQLAYQMAKRREEKTRITEELVDYLRSRGRFVLFDPQTQLWYEVSPEYAREKVSHSLRSRPERRRVKPAARKKAAKKTANFHALDDIVAHIIQDQQGILKGLMAKESDRMTAEAIMRETLGHSSQD